MGNKQSGPKFPTGIEYWSKRKIGFHSLFSTSYVSVPAPIVKLAQMVYANLERNFPLIPEGDFAYHLQKP